MWRNWSNADTKHEMLDYIIFEADQHEQDKDKHGKDETV